MNNPVHDSNKWWIAVNMFMYLQVPQNVGTLSNWGNISFLRRALFQELVILLNVYTIKHQFIIVRWISTLCVSFWTHQLFTIFHYKTYLGLFYWIVISYHQAKLINHYHCQYRIILLRTILIYVNSYGRNNGLDRGNLYGGWHHCVFSSFFHNYTYHCDIMTYFKHGIKIRAVEE